MICAHEHCNKMCVVMKCYVQLKQDKDSIRLLLTTTMSTMVHNKFLLAWQPNRLSIASLPQFTVFSSIYISCTFNPPVHTQLFIHIQTHTETHSSTSPSCLSYFLSQCFVSISKEVFMPYNQPLLFQLSNLLSKSSENRVGFESTFHDGTWHIQDTYYSAAWSYTYDTSFNILNNF